MSSIKKYLPWTLRVLLFALFMLSAIAKMFPLWSFEKQLVDLGIASWCASHYLARLIIGFELALGIAILQGNYLKKIIIPVTILLLVAFNIHLSIQMYQHGAMNGNCGCFGQLIPMTPLEAFVKNLITIGLLIYLYTQVSDKEKGQNSFMPLWLIGTASALVMFLFFPFCPCPKPEVKLPVVAVQQDSSMVVNTDTLIKPDSIKMASKPEIKEEEKPEEKGPKKINSVFTSFTTFGNKTTDLNSGKKIVCMFSAGCDHCQETAKTLAKLAREDKNFPEMYILFMDEETYKIPEFFTIAGRTFPYTVIDIPKFWQVIGDGNSTPGVFYLWNGNLIKSYAGTEDNKFNAAGLKQAINKK